MNPGRIVIVGGGAAGWMSACLMAHHWRTEPVEVTVVESQTIGTVGVGEGSTPFLRDFFTQLGITEQEWMPACNATYKCGIRFSGWSERPGFGSYFHPFNTELDQPGAVQFFKDCYARRMGYELTPVPDDYFAASAIGESGRTPFALMSDRSAKPLTDYGYHFDSHLLGKFLQRHALSLGVKHIDDTVVHVERNESGDISALQLAQQPRLRGDFFVDCSGFKSLLMRQALQVPFISCRQRLVNNAAVALASEHTSPGDTDVADGAPGYPTETLAHAMSNGWMWRIPLTERWGNGYVFNSDDASFADVEQQLRAHLGLKSDAFSARHLQWESGRLQNHWRNNCIAIGLSQGFLEPLEAPMLRIIQFTCKRFIDLYQRLGASTQARQAFDKAVNGLIDGNIDYLQAHYLVSARTDTAYWRAARANTHISPLLRRLLQAWRGRGSFDAVLGEFAEELVYHKTSWYCLLAGKGEFSAACRTTPAVAHMAQHQFKEHNARLARQCMLAEAV
ncbi:tryptophan halogenase family protein [Gilvimarinus sp. DA14]|uniref:tryptophan halogenase family protein n=1 Tax=Gilvimarinus sp. DA14 TaxID=2956798 RepID=UPI0020B8B1FF|nr:tryptophan halogenase family protein [Gilvimarinus sp. DA14]UTF59866.1 tryptophan 7-halogenase [Gilvimarinus sp. DA14]